MTDSTRYQPREPFFANKAIRLMIKTCLPNDIGTDAFALLVVVAQTEDAAHYRRPVTFFNGQLMPILGIKSPHSLIRARARAIDSGWLAYEQGGRGVPGKYWILIPKHAAGLDDSPVDEGAISANFAQKDAPEVGMNANFALKPHHNGNESDIKRAILLPVPDPVPKSSSSQNRRPANSPDQTAEWQPVLKRMRNFGVRKAREAIVAAIANGCTPDHVDTLISEAERRAAWVTPGGLYDRVCDASPELQTSAGWPSEPLDKKQTRQSLTATASARASDTQAKAAANARKASAKDLERQLGAALNAMNPEQLQDLAGRSKCPMPPQSLSLAKKPGAVREQFLKLLHESKQASRKD
jgi:hypothetical protein